MIHKTDSGGIYFKLNGKTVYFSKNQLEDFKSKNFEIIKDNNGYKIPKYNIAANLFGFTVDENGYILDYKPKEDKHPLINVNKNGDLILGKASCANYERNNCIDVETHTSQLLNGFND